MDERNFTMVWFSRFANMGGTLWDALFLYLIGAVLFRQIIHTADDITSLSIL